MSCVVSESVSAVMIKNKIANTAIARGEGVEIFLFSDKSTNWVATGVALSLFATRGHEVC